MNQQKHYVDILFIIVLIGLFAVSSVALALLGVNVYKTTSTSDNDQLNTGSLYLAQKVRQCENKDQIRIANLDGEVPALVIGQTIKGKELETCLFVMDGTLKEVTVISGSEIDPQYGQEIMDMKSIDYKMITSHLLQVTLTAKDDSTSVINLSLIGGSGNE